MTQLLSAKQVAGMLKVGVSTVYEWTKGNKIPFVLLNGSIRFDEADIEKWIKARKVEARAIGQ